MLPTFSPTLSSCVHRYAIFLLESRERLILADAVVSAPDDETMRSLTAAVELTLTTAVDPRGAIQAGYLTHVRKQQAKHKPASMQATVFEEALVEVLATVAENAAGEATTPPDPKTVSGHPFEAWRFDGETSRYVYPRVLPGARPCGIYTLHTP